MADQLHPINTKDLFDDSTVKNPPTNTRAVGLIPGSGRPPKEGNAVFLLGKSHGQRSLGGYSLWGHKSQTSLSNKTTINTKSALRGFLISTQDYLSTFPLVTVLGSCTLLKNPTSINLLCLAESDLIDLLLFSPQEIPE